MHSLTGRLSRLLILLAALTMIAFFIVILLGVLFRYVLSRPLVWSEEAAELLSVWSVFLGAAAAVHESDHLRVDVLDRFVERWPAVGQKALSLVLIAAEALFAWSLLYGGWHMTVDRWDVPLTTLPVNQGWFYIAAPISAAAMILFLVGQAFETVTSLTARG